MTSILSAEHRASRRPALFEVSLKTSSSEPRQRQDKKRKESRRDCFVWAPPSSLLVILHYLLKSNIQDFNTGWYTQQLSRPLGFLPKFAWGVLGTWEDQR